MRTYSRKRPVYQVIEGVHELCRLCLGKSQEFMPIFTDDTDNVCVSLAMRIMICVGLEVVRDSCLPNSICMECYNELQNCYAFRKKCEVTYQKLKFHVLAAKEREVKNKSCSDLKVEANRTLSENSDDKYDDSQSNYVMTFHNDSENTLLINGAENGSVNGNPDLMSLLKKSIDTRTEVTVEVDESQVGYTVSEHEAVNPEITPFLSTILMELGVLVQQDNEMIVVGNYMKTLQLETGDDDVISLELVEEDEEETTQKSALLPNETPGGISIDMDIDEKEKDYLVRYVTPEGTLQKKLSSSSTGTECQMNKSGSSWQCSVCGARVLSRSAAARHRSAHSGRRPHACSRCPRTFTQRSLLRRHELVHAEDRPFKCDSCDKSFTQRGALASHARQHAPPPARALLLHRCVRCPKQFLHASGLSRHLKAHEGRVFVCGACRRHFTDKSSLRRHFRSSGHARPPA